MFFVFGRAGLGEGVELATGGCRAGFGGGGRKAAPGSSPECGQGITGDGDGFRRDGWRGGEGSIDEL